jgi:hypothetical protein
MWASLTWPCLAWTFIKRELFSAVKKPIFDAHLGEKTPIFSYYMSLNKFLQIKRWSLIENINDPADTFLKEDHSIDATFGPS